MLEGIRLAHPAELEGSAAEQFWVQVHELVARSQYRTEAGLASAVERLLASRLSLPSDWAVMPLRSGTDALIRALHLTGAGPRKKVIVPDLAFQAVAAAVCQVGAEPVFADVDPLCWNLDPRS